MNRIVPIVLLSLCTFALSSCHNVRQYERGNIRFITKHWGDDKFSVLEIGSPQSPYDGVPQFLIKMSDGTIVNPATTDIRQIEIKCAGKSDYSGLPYSDCSSRPFPASSSRWPESTVRLQDLSRVFFVCSNRVMAVRIRWNETDNWASPEIGNLATGQMFSFPLNEKTVRALFGKPDQITKHLND